MAARKGTTPVEAPADVQDTVEPVEAPADVQDTVEPVEAPADVQDTVMESPEGDTYTIVAAGVQALLALGWTIVD